jgi:hypothetical protein
MIKKTDLLFVYDVQLHRKIKQQGFEYLTSAISLADRRFWLYPRTSEILSIMDAHIQHTK